MLTSSPENTSSQLAPNKEELEVGALRATTEQLEPCTEALTAEDQLLMLASLLDELEVDGQFMVRLKASDGHGGGVRKPGMATAFLH